MTMHAKDKQIEMIGKAVQHIYEKFPQEEAVIIEKFVKTFYSSADPEDLIGLSIIDLYGLMLSNWNFILHRKPHEAKVRVYNPQFEQHGWQSTHSVLEVLHDDMPFIMESIRMELNRRGFSLHLILHMSGLCFERSEKGVIKDVAIRKKKSERVNPETAFFIEFDRQSDPKILEQIKIAIEGILEQIQLCVQDWPSMIHKMQEIIDSGGHDNKESQETMDFLSWLKEDNFTFLGYCQMDVPGSIAAHEWLMVENTQLGLIRQGVAGYFINLDTIQESVREKLFTKDLVLVGKTNRPSQVHRPAHHDFIMIKSVNEQGEITAFHCFIGLYTSEAYNLSLNSIPLLRHKVKKILSKASFTMASHDGKALLNILETIPRDDLFQGTIDELYKTAMGILYLQERKRIKFFLRKDVFGQFYSCLVFVPRDRFNSSLRIKFSRILEEELHGTLLDFNSHFSESVLCRVHFVISINSQDNVQVDVEEIERKLIDAARTWEDSFKSALVEHFGEEEGNRLIYSFASAFPAGYRASFQSRTAVFDVSHIQNLKGDTKLSMSFYRPLEEPSGHIRFKLFHADSAIPLSDVIPMLECMGLRIINQRPHEITDRAGRTVWINDFGMTHESGADLNVEAVKDVFQEAFYNIWDKNAESDGFNRLVLSAGLNWQEVTMLRAYAKYLWQIGFTFSQSYVEETLAKHNVIARQLVELFILRFDPTLPQETKNEKTNSIRRKIKDDLEAVQNLDEDRILRRFVHVIMATIRTNFFQRQANGKPKNYLSFKLDPATIPEMPLPRPMFEIFVYSPRVEGVHLRGAKVARGGLRWSDRREDFRTEVLGLMKAQQVKNAVIVPLGAKGGFVPKNLPQGSRDDILNEGIACYKIFISALLDITDNLIDGKVVPPNDTVRYDGEDPYLVVAADKGTATFSDIANSVSKDYNFWLSDAFASGGSAGYDHKKMGITARGAWESVKRHFMELGIDPQSDDFTVIGIGDMAGDVFGNGMLLSEHIKLIGAFNHMHIFIDPEPNVEKSFKERKRLFELPRSAWSDYDSNLISSGGGVFQRSAKSIVITPEIKALFGITEDKLIPNDLIKVMMKAKVDLLWNGGIGTYVKSCSELHTEVGDRANDALRVNGMDLRCKVVGEGGNLGFTQLGRVEFALQGGKINTDAIDNSGGVNSSDVEVNIKILLNGVVAKGDLTLKQRNVLLESMTKDVAEFVLFNNRNQCRGISIAQLDPSKNINMYSRLIEFLEVHANLNRSIEFLPAQDVLLTRKKKNQGITRPELAVIFAYTKTWLKEELLNSDLPEDPFVSQIIESAFPQGLHKDYRSEMQTHRLRREIIVTQIANRVINNMGPSFIIRLQDETGASVPEIIRAYMIAREVFFKRKFYEEVESLDNVVDGQLQLTLLYEFNRLIRRATRWFLRHCPNGIQIEDAINDFKPGVEKVMKDIKHHLKGEVKDYLEQSASEYMDMRVPKELAYKAGAIHIYSSALDIVQASIENRLAIDQVMSTYFSIGARLELGWFRQQIKQHPVASLWDALARAGFRDDLDKQQRRLTVSILQMEGEVSDIEAKIDAWMTHHKALVSRFRQMANELKALPTRNFTMYSVALRELFDLSQSSQVTEFPGKYK